jgi:hypothetical protein
VPPWFERVYVRDVDRNQEAFIETFGRGVLPRLAGA